LCKLSLSNNYLDDTTPKSLGNLRTLGSIDISCNFLSGRIPQEILSIPSITILLNLSNNALSGSIPAQIGNLNNLVSIDLSMNKLTDEIPDAVGSYVQLRLLHLHGNLLQGKIPKGLRTLGVLENLALSSNNLTGPIPEFLENIKTQNNLNLSFNRLSGPVPDTGLFCNATILSLTGNSMLAVHHHPGSPWTRWKPVAGPRERLSPTCVCIAQSGVCERCI
jgi:Leucine-rich repeat (LRR) protein